MNAWAPVGRGDWLIRAGTPRPDRCLTTSRAVRYTDFMFRVEPQAFLALLQDPGDSELRTVIRDTLDAHGVRTSSAEEVSSTTALPTAIQERIREADFVIADITSAQPSVMVEVGMALGMGKRMLLLSKGRSSELPFPLATQQVAVYRPGDVGSVKKYIELWLRDVMSERESPPA